MHVSDFDESTEIVRMGRGAGVIVTCEHASERLPAPWQWPREDRWLLGTHWAFDLGAASLTREYAETVGCVAVLARFTRLLCDPNRPESSPTLFRTEAEALPVHLNAHLDDAERERRLERYYRPFHEAVSREVAATHADVLLAMHTFTPVYDGFVRELEVGVLFDHEEALAERLVRGIADAGFLVEPNEPYSGREGLIHVAHTHAERHGRRAIEIEVRQDLATDPAFRARFVPVLASLIG
jgi:predicted N-formylglutamate amidohydrolase